MASEERPAVRFIAHSHQVLSSCIHLLGVSVLSYCLTHRMPPLNSLRQWTNMSWGRLCVILVLLDSWLFIFFTGVLVNGVGLSYSHQTCALAIYACISFYVMSKILIYGFLTEKVYVVWSDGNQTSRFKTPAYRLCSFVLLGYVIVVVLMIVGQNSSIRQDGICVIGLKNFATIPMISYDLFLNAFLTIMFLWPLWRSNVMSHKLRNIATRTLYGAIVSLTTSAANIAVLTILRGEEFGWVCLASCVTDVAFNAIALSWVTAGSYSRKHITLDRFSLPTLNVVPVKLDCQLEKEAGYYGKTVHENPFPLPESYYDYIPRSQMSQPQPQPQMPRRAVRKCWFRCLRPAWRCPRRSSSSILPLSGPAMQSMTLSEEEPISPPLQPASADHIIGDTERQSTEGSEVIESPKHSSL